MRVCVRAPTPSCPAQPSPPHPCHLAPIQALPFLPTPLQTALSASFNQGFPSLDPQYHFYLCTYSFLSWSLALRKNQVTREIFSIKGLTYCVEVTLPATQCSTKRCTLESCRSCLLHKHNIAHIMAVAQSSMMTFLSSCRSFSLFCNTSSRCWCMSAATWVLREASVLVWMLRLERVSMNTAQLEYISVKA